MKQTGKLLLPTEPPVEGAESHQEAGRAQQGEAESHQAMAGETGLFGRYIHWLQSVLTDLITK